LEGRWEHWQKRLEVVPSNRGTSAGDHNDDYVRAHYNDHGDNDNYANTRSKRALPSFHNKSTR